MHHKRTGVKFDDNKTDWSMLPWAEVEQVCRAFEYGGRKYQTNDPTSNASAVPEGRRRYFAACLRHLLAWYRGEALDPESGLHHLAHAAACLLILLHKEAT